MTNTLWKLPITGEKHFVGKGNKLLSLIKRSVPITQIVYHIRWFDKKSYDFIGELKMDQINHKYLRKTFELEDNDKMLLSYVINQKHKKYLEKFSRLNIDLEKYDYFMES